MSTTDILEAFAIRLKALTLSPELPVAWPGLPKKPPSAGMWLETRFFPNEPGDLTWGDTAQTEITGFFQIFVYYRPGVNTGQNSLVDVLGVVDEILVHFPKGLPIDDANVRKGPWQGPAVDLEGKSFVPVTIPYRGIITTGVIAFDTNYVVNNGVYVVDAGIQVISS